MSVPASSTSKFLIGLAFAWIVAVPVSAQEFFKGKTIVVIVGTAAGGGFDTYSRMIARHLGKYLPGNPIPSFRTCPVPGS